MEINLIIRDLLAKYNYISLPGLGSFIQKYEPAYPSADGRSFIAPKQSITFDSSRTFNDEAIENYLCEKRVIGHSVASELLAEFVKKIQEELDKGKECTFENVGTLSKNSKGKIQFEQAKDLDAAISTYGLKDIDVAKTIKPVKQKTSPKSEPHYVLSKSEVKPTKTSSLKVFIGVATVLVIAALTVSIIMIPEFRFWKNFTNSNTTLIGTKTDTSNKITTKLSQGNTQPDTSLSKKDTLTTKVDKTITDNTVKKTALYYAEPKMQDNKTFYLIVGSFGSLDNAQKLADKYNRKGFKTEIIQGNSMFRVSLNKFTDKNRALSEFNKFRNDYPNESVWLLGV